MLGTAATLPVALRPDGLAALGREGYVVRRMKTGETVIAANSDIGLLYGAFAWLRAANTGVALERIDERSAGFLALGLARGSGTRSLAGMRPARGRLLRPFLGLRRADTLEICEVEGLDPWHDPSNADPAFARSRTRVEVLPLLEEKGMSARLIAGSAYGLRSPAVTHSPLFYLHAELQSGTAVALPDGYSERAVFIAKGRLAVDGTTYQAGQMLVFTGDTPVRLQALEQAQLMLLGGEPVGARHIWWNFVSSSKERIEQAKQDWKTGRFAAVPQEHEFIPLPE